MFSINKVLSQMHFSSVEPLLIVTARNAKETNEMKQYGMFIRTESCSRSFIEPKDEQRKTKLRKFVSGKPHSSVSSTN